MGSDLGYAERLKAPCFSLKDYMLRAISLNWASKLKFESLVERKLQLAEQWSPVWVFLTPPSSSRCVPWNSWKCRFLGPSPESLNQVFFREEAQQSVLTSPTGDSVSGKSFGTTGREAKESPMSTCIFS